MRSDGSLRPPKPPRGLVLGTGEEVPKGQSLRGRIGTLEIVKGDMDWSRLTTCQKDAAAGFYAQAMAAYVHWLASRYAEIKASLKEEVRTLRDQVLQGVHRRTPEMVAQLAVGIRYFLQFAVEMGAITQVEREKLWKSAWKALGEAAHGQARFLGESDPAQRFIELLHSAIASGEAHVADHSGGKPQSPGAWGWRAVTISTVEGVCTEWRPQGKRIGWLNGDALYLEPNASFTTAQALASRQGDALPVTLQTLKARLKEDGYLLSWDAKRQRNTMRRVVEEKEMAVLHLAQKVFLQDPLSPLRNRPNSPVTKAPTGIGKTRQKNRPVRSEIVQLRKVTGQKKRKQNQDNLPQLDGMDGCVLRERGQTATANRKAKMRRNRPIQLDGFLQLVTVQPKRKTVRRPWRKYERKVNYECSSGLTGKMPRARY